MAIKRVDTAAKFKVICEFDEALERETAEELAALDQAKEQPRYQKYLENLDESHLKFKNGLTPDRFLIRCLKNNEVAEMQAKHFSFDTDSRQLMVKNPSLSFLDHFNTGCLGILDETGVPQKVTADEVGFAVAVNIGSIIAAFTTLGKNLKK